MKTLSPVQVFAGDAGVPAAIHRAPWAPLTEDEAIKFLAQEWQEDNDHKELWVAYFASLQSEMSMDPVVAVRKGAPFVARYLARLQVWFDDAVTQWLLKTPKGAVQALTGGRFRITVEFLDPLPDGTMQEPFVEDLSAVAFSQRRDVHPVHHLDGTLWCLLPSRTTHMTITGQVDAPLEEHHYEHPSHRFVDGRGLGPTGGDAGPGDGGAAAA